MANTGEYNSELDLVFNLSPVVSFNQFLLVDKIRKYKKDGVLKNDLLNHIDTEEEFRDRLKSVINMFKSMAQNSNEDEMKGICQEQPDFEKRCLYETNKIL